MSSNTSGKTHVDADCLSRYPLDIQTPNEETEIPTWPIHQPKKSISTVRYRQELLDELTRPVYDVTAEQASDDFCKPILDLMKDLKANKKVLKRYKHFTLIDSILYRRSKRNPKKLVLVLPKSMVDFVLIEAHDKPLGGHFGVKRTMDTIKYRFY